MLCRFVKLPIFPVSKYKWFKVLDKLCCLFNISAVPPEDKSQTAALHNCLFLQFSIQPSAQFLPKLTLFCFLSIGNVFLKCLACPWKNKISLGCEVHQIMQ
jgi:hypothetical protein